MPVKPKQIVVLLRESCDPRPPVRITADGFSVRERGLRRIANPADLCALEQGLRLAEEQHTSVTVVAIGTQRQDELLRLGLAMGAQRAVRVWHSALADGDAVAQACLLERIITILGSDFFLTGNCLLDRGDAREPALASARLGMPCVNAALSLSCIDGGMEVMRKCDRGARQIVAVVAPCVLLFTADCCEPRYPQQQALQSALNAEIETWSLAELGLPLNILGLQGSKLGKERCSFPRSNPKRVVTPDANLPAFDRILALLSGGIKPREGKLHQLSVEQTVDKLMDIFKAEGLVGGETK